MKRIVLPPAAAVGVSQKGVRNYRDTYKDLNIQKAAKLQLRNRLLRQQMFTCIYCDCSLIGLRANIEHMTPVKFGGTNNSNNLVMSCSNCNKKKGNRMLSKHKKKMYQHKAAALRLQATKEAKAHYKYVELNKEIEEEIAYSLFTMFSD